MKPKRERTEPKKWWVSSVTVSLIESPEGKGGW